MMTDFLPNAPGKKIGRRYYLQCDDCQHYVSAAWFLEHWFGTHAFKTPEFDAMYERAFERAVGEKRMNEDLERWGVK